MGDNPAMPETAERPPDLRDRALAVLPADVHQRRRLVALLAAVGVVAVVVAVVLLVSSGGDDPPSTAAAKLVPSNALVFLNVSTDPDRDGVKRAVSLGGKLPAFRAVRSTIERRLGSRQGPINFARDVRPWLGDEAALAVLPTSGTVSESEIVLDVPRRRDPSLRHGGHGVRVGRPGHRSRAGHPRRHRPLEGARRQPGDGQAVPAGLRRPAGRPGHRRLPLARRRSPAPRAGRRRPGARGPRGRPARAAGGRCLGHRVGRQGAAQGPHRARPGAREGHAGHVQALLAAASERRAQRRAGLPGARRPRPRRGPAARSTVLATAVS